MTDTSPESVIVALMIARDDLAELRDQNLWTWCRYMSVADLLDESIAQMKGDFS